MESEPRDPKQGSPPLKSLLLLLLFLLLLFLSSSQSLSPFARPPPRSRAHELGLEASEGDITLQALADGSVQELFVTASTTMVTPIVRVDGKAVGDGTVGPVARALLAAFDEWLRAGEKEWASARPRL